MNTLKIQQTYFVAAGSNEVYDVDFSPIDSLDTDPQQPIYAKSLHKPFRPKGTTPETVQYIKDIVVTGLHWILSPLL